MLQFVICEFADWNDYNRQTHKLQYWLSNYHNIMLLFWEALMPN